MRTLVLLALILSMASCGSRGRENRKENALLKEEYIKKGAEIAAQTQAELLKNVSQAMGSGGPVYAIDFCNLKAMELKDSLSRENQATIQRISMKYRNPVDAPGNEREEAQLSAFQEAHDKGDTLLPKLFVLDNRLEYYQAITIHSGACLLCHGEPGSQIAPETQAAINERYPGDLATGYAMHDLRGAWKITFQLD
jgi:hypothetical protein